MLQQDSIIAGSNGVEGDSLSVSHTVVTPAMVLSWLPRTATPAQQDSAIQAHFKPSEIRWSMRPDTLHLPGHDKGHNLLDVQLPQYYREGFFSKDTLFHPELPGGRYGTAGDPVPYSVHGDNVLTLLLLSCFIVAVVAFSNVRGFFARQAKHFLNMTRPAATEITETATEIRFQVFLAFLAGLLLSLLFYFYTLHYIGETFVLKSQYHLIVIYMVIIACYMLFKTMVQTLVNMVFFDGKKSIQWIKAMLFITSVEGIVLFPVVILRAYFDLSIQNVVIYFIIVLLIVKILTIFKAFVIFFHRNVVSLQIILYFCALEMVPLLALWGTLVFTANNLKIIF
jgi:hypothetical protein